mgnify:FL=1
MRLRVPNPTNTQYASLRKYYEILSEYGYLSWGDVKKLLCMTWIREAFDTPAVEETMTAEQRNHLYALLRCFCRTSPCCVLCEGDELPDFPTGGNGDEPTIEDEGWLIRIQNDMDILTIQQREYIKKIQDN